MVSQFARNLGHFDAASDARTNGEHGADDDDDQQSQLHHSVTRCKQESVQLEESTKQESTSSDNFSRFSCAVPLQAVELFLDEKIGYMDIVPVIERCCEAHRAEFVEAPGLEEIVHFDTWARDWVAEHHREGVIV